MNARFIQKEQGKKLDKGKRSGKIFGSLLKKIRDAFPAMRGSGSGRENIKKKKKTRKKKNQKDQRRREGTASIFLPISARKSAREHQSIWS